MNQKESNVLWETNTDKILKLIVGIVLVIVCLYVR